MKDLIEALTILLTYGENTSPTYCEYDTLHLFAAVGNDEISDDHKARLKELSFHEDEDGGFYSFRFGSF